MNITEDPKDPRLVYGNKAEGQNDTYLVLSEEERSKGFVKPYRDRYTHKKCNSVTTMSRAIAETYARDPHFYSQTFCVSCNKHFLLSEFIWSRDGEPMDPAQQEAWKKMTANEAPIVETHKTFQKFSPTNAELDARMAKLENRFNTIEAMVRTALIRMEGER